MPWRLPAPHALRFPLSLFADPPQAPGRPLSSYGRRRGCPPAGTLFQGLKGAMGPVPLCQGRALIFIRLLLARIWGRVCCHRSHTLVFHSICRIRWCCQGSCRRNPCTATHHFYRFEYRIVFRGKPALVILHSSSWIVGYFSFPSSSSLMRSMMNFMAPYPSSSLASKISRILYFCPRSKSISNSSSVAVRPST